MSTKLFEVSNRDEAHRALADVLSSGKHPHAECREDPNLPEPYQVWSGPVDREAELRGTRLALEEPRPVIVDGLSADEVAALKSLLAQLKGSL